MKRTINGLVLFLALSGILWLYSPDILADETFPAQYYPDSPHPRLWLNENHLNMLSAARDLNTPQWQNFEAECHDLLTEVHWGGPAWGVPGTALMYLLTGETTYLDRAVEFMHLALDEPSSGNDAGHGLYGYLGLGYDWLYHSMNPADRTAIANKMIHWSNYVWEFENGNGTVAYGQDTDHIIMTGSAHLMMGAALYDDVPEAVDMLDRAWWIWTRGCGSIPPDGIVRNGQQAQPVQRWIRDALGGIFYPGWSYFSGTDSIGLHQYYVTLRSACNYDILIHEPELSPFWGNVITSTIHLMTPDGAGLYHTGDWQDPNTIENTAYFHQCLTLASWEADRAGHTHKADMGRGFADSIDSYNHFGFLEFFFRDPYARSIDPMSQNLQPVVFIQGCDYLFYRTGWGAMEDWTLFSGQGGEPADHQTPDTGNFVIFRQDDYLTKDCRVYGPVDLSVAFNVMSIENTLPYGSTLMSQFDAPAYMERHMECSDSSPPLAYGMVNGDDQWDEDPNEWEPVIRVDSYRRHFVRTGEYAVVLDRLHTSDIGWCKYRLRSLTEPAINNTTQTINQTSPNGRHRLLHRTLTPPSTLTKINERTAWEGVFEEWEIYPEERKWQVEIQPPDGDSLVMLNVMQTGPNDLTDFDNLIYYDNSHRLGATLGNWFFQFDKSEDLQNEIEYTLSNAEDPMNHFIADLEPGLYQVTAGSYQSLINVPFESCAAKFTTEQFGTVTINLQRTGGVPTVQLQMPDIIYQSGDFCECKVLVENTGNQTVSGYPLWVFLDVFGAYYFAPEFRQTTSNGWPEAHRDFYLMDYKSGITTLNILPGFTWPEGVGSASGIVWYAAMTDPGYTRIISNLDSWMFGWQ